MKLIRRSLLVFGLALAATSPAAQPAGASRAILFEQPNFQGRWVTLFRDAPDLRRRTFDGHASSGHFDGAWTVCDRPGFTGRCRTLSGDVPDLAGPVLSLRPGGTLTPVAATQSTDDGDDEGYFDRSAGSAPPAPTSASGPPNH